MTDTEFLRTADVAALLTLSPATLRYWRHIGSGPASFKLGRRVMYRREAVLDWIAEQEQAAAAQRARRAEQVGAA